MLSHACASCGKVLDGRSRSYSAELRMWIARCGRCGFAVRWTPREAREHRFELDAARVFGAFRGADGAVAPPLGRYALRVGDVEAPALLSVEVEA